MAKNLFAVEVHDGNVIFVGLEPLLLPGLGDVDRLQFEGSRSPYLFNYEKSTSAERAIGLGEERDAVHGLGDPATPFVASSPSHTP